MILYVTPGGRLGNQLFQLAFLESVRRPNELVFCTGMGGVKKLAPGIRRVFNSDAFFLIKIFDYLVMPFLRFLAGIRLISAFLESEGAHATMASPPSFGRRFRFIEGYFQDSAVVTDRWKKKLSGALDERLLRENQPPEGRTPIFVHIRRTDYAGFSVLDGSRTMLPLAYYHDALELVRAAVPSPLYIFTGDDPDFAEHAFRDCQPRMIRRARPLQDFAMMVQCEGGILSNSSFCFWAAMLCRQTAPLIGPRFWLGWQKRAWHPSGIQAQPVRYIDVRES